MAIKFNIVAQSTFNVIGNVSIVTKEEDGKVSAPALRFESITNKAGKAMSINAADVAADLATMGLIQPSLINRFLKDKSFGRAFIGTSSPEEAMKIAAQMEAWINTNTPKRAGVVQPRKVDDVIAKGLADLLLVLAGTSGVIPETFTVSENILTAAKKLAAEKANLLGKNELGEFRLQKPKGSGDNNIPVNVTTSETTTTSETCEGSEDEVHVGDEEEVTA